MKAWQLQQLGDPWDELRIKTVDLPAPGLGIVQVRVEATDVNFADILQCQGNYQVQLDLPFIPGIFTAGVVIATGADCEFQVGDRIIGPTLDGWGGYAEQAMIPSKQAFHLPDGVTCFAAAGMHVTFGTAWFALHHRGKLQPGETVLVLAAAGGVGSAAVHMAKAHGCWVIAAAGGQDKVQVCRQLGADEVIDYNTEDLYQTVKQLTDGRGVDVVYDPVGGDYFDMARRLVAWEGRLLVIGFASGRIPSAPVSHALVKNYSIVGVHMGGYQTQNPAILQRCFEDLYEQFLDGKIDPLITDTIGFDALPPVLKRLSNRGTTGRIIFDPTIA